MRPDLPPGYRMRTATLDDIPAIVAVGRACELDDIGESDVFENWVHDEWVRPRFDPSTDAWVVTEPGGAVVAATYTWDEEPHTLFDTAGWVHPAHRGRGIGTALVLAVEAAPCETSRRGIGGALLRAAFAMFLDRGVANVRLNVDRDNTSGATHLYERAGMRLRRRWLTVAKTMTAAADGSS